MADIGSHWFDMTKHLTNRRVSGLSADLQIFHKIRKWPKVGIETFPGTRLQSEDYDLVPIDTEDFGAVTSGVGERTRGPVTASQVSRGQKNRLKIEIYGSKCFVMWDQERPDELWIGYRNTNNQILVKDPTLLRDHTRLSRFEGSTQRRLLRYLHTSVRSFNASLANGLSELGYSQFRDGLRQLHLVESGMESSRKQGWVEITSEC